MQDLDAVFLVGKLLTTEEKFFTCVEDADMKSSRS